MSKIIQVLKDLFASKALLTYEELLQLIDDVVIDAPKENVNTSSIDVTLDSVVLIEKSDMNAKSSAILLGDGQSIKLENDEIDDEFGFYLLPGEFILASTVETLNLPDNISAEYKLKSSMARSGLEHLSAGWIDAGFNGKLTLEIKNMLQHQTLNIEAGMKCGQIVFFRHKRVPKHASYSTRGRYNGQDKVTASKGVV